MAEKEDEHRIPPPPKAVLAALRRAEARLDELAADPSLLRQALEESPLPTVEDVAARITHHVEIADQAHATDGISVVVLPPTVTGSAAIEGRFEVTASGHVNAADEPPAEVRSWAEKMRPWGTAGYRVADLALRAYSAFHGGA